MSEHLELNFSFLPLENGVSKPRNYAKKGKTRGVTTRVACEACRRKKTAVRSRKRSFYKFNADGMTLDTSVMVFVQHVETAGKVPELASTTLMSQARLESKLFIEKTNSLRLYSRPMRTSIPS